MGSSFRRPPRARNGLWALALGACVAHADPDLVRRSQDLVQRGQAAAAYQLLQAEESRWAGDVNFDVAFAIAANEAGQFPRAIIALERVLAVQPGHQRARAEMGRALYGVGDVKAARTLLTESREKGFISVAGETIDQLLHSIDRIEAEGQSSWRGWIEFAIGDDTNINSSPGLSNVAVPAYGGSILAINPGGTGQRGHYAMLGGGLSGRYVLDPRWSLIGNASARAHLYEGANNRFDTRQFDVNTGVSYRVERDEYALAIQAGTYDIDYARARDHSGLVAEWTHRFDGFRQFNAYVQLSRLIYPAQRIADADRRIVGFTYAHLTRGGMWTYGGAYGGEERALDGSVPHLGHRVLGLRGGIQVPVTPAIGGFASGGYEWRRFGGADPLFLENRRDRQFNVALGLSWVPARDWRVTPQWSLADTHSNVPLAKYRKRAVSLAVRKEF